MYYIYILFILFGFTVTYFINLKKNKKQLQELILLLNNNCYHIHHYITILVGIIVIIITRYIKQEYFILFLSFLFGVILEDFLYKDFNKIKNNCNTKQIIKFFNKKI